MHTENQAASLWCPMVRHTSGNGCAYNRGIADAFGCVASRCAMWQWGEEPANRPRFVQARNSTDKRPSWVPETWPMVVDDDIGWKEPQEVANERRPMRRGYCGIAGKPEFQ